VLEEVEIRKRRRRHQRVVLVQTGKEEKGREEDATGRGERFAH